MLFFKFKKIELLQDYEQNEIIEIVPLTTTILKLNKKMRGILYDLTYVYVFITNS